MEVSDSQWTAQFPYNYMLPMWAFTASKLAFFFRLATPCSCEMICCAKLWRWHLAQSWSQWDLKGKLVKHIFWGIDGIFSVLFTIWNTSSKCCFQSPVRRKKRKLVAPSKRRKKEVIMTKQTRTGPGGRQVYSLTLFTFQRRVNCGVLNLTLHLGSLSHTMNNKYTLEDRRSDPKGFVHF